MTASGRQPEQISPWPFAGMIGMACVFFVYAATPVVVDAPWWVVVALLLVWTAGLVQAVRWFTPRPVALAVLPVGLAVLWFAVVLGGARYLDWA